jgi:cell wall-associated NlpC family hydrolase
MPFIHDRPECNQTVMSGYRAARMPTRRALALVVAFVVATSPVAVARAAWADAVSDKQQQVDRILARIDALGDQANRLNEQRNGAELQLQQAQAQLADAQQRLADLDTDTAGLQDDLKRFLVASYVVEGDDSGLAGLLDPAAAASSAARAGYTAALSGARGDVIESYQAAIQAQAQQRSQQATLTNRIQDATAQLARTQQQIDAVLGQQKSELAKAKGDLAAAVVAEQKRRAEEQARKDREEAAAAAARLAAQQAAADAARQSAAARLATPAPRTGAAPSGGGGAGAGGGGGGGGADGGGGAVPAPPVIAAASPRAAVAVRAALSQLGVPYAFATMEPGVSFDCSGLTKWAWGQAGVGMDHFTGSQLEEFPRVPLDQLLPGDLVFPDAGHVGIYIGNGQMVHAPRTGDVVKISNVVGRIWAAVRPG